MLRFLAKCCPVYIMIILFQALLSAISSVANVYLFKYILDALTNNYRINYIIKFILILFAFNLVYYAFNSICTKILLPKYSQIIHKNIQIDLFNRTSQMRFELYDDAIFYNKFSFALQETEKRGFAVLNTFSKLICSLFSIIGFVLLIIGLEYRLVFVVILGVFVTFLLNKSIVKIQHAFDVESIQPKREAQYISRVNYLKEYAQELKLYGFSALKELYISANNRLLCLIESFGKKIAALTFFQNAISAIVSTVSMIYLAMRVFSQTIPISAYVMLNSCTIQLYSQINSLLNVINEIYEHSLYIGNIKGFLNDDELLQKYGDDKISNAVTSIKIINVSYRYANSNYSNLLNISLNIKLNEKIAIVGKNGAGKSTLLKLLARIYDPTDGTITMDGKDYREYCRSSFYSTISFQPQDFKLYSINLAENILMRKVKNVEDEHLVVEALKFVGLYEKVFSYPENIYSVFTSEFSSRGIYLSNGEMQKLSLARAYACKGCILLFDEPTSTLDVMAEAEYLNKLLQLEEKTILVVTHSIQNARRFNRIILMDKGQIVGDGTHEELLFSNEFYKRMLNISK